MNRKEAFRRISLNQNNVRFGDLEDLVFAFGFRLKRIRGSHRLYSHPLVRQRLNLQMSKGEATPYQVRQFLKLVEEHNLKLEDGE